MPARRVVRTPWHLACSVHRSDDAGHPSRGSMRAAGPLQFADARRLPPPSPSADLCRGRGHRHELHDPRPGPRLHPDRVRPRVRRRRHDHHGVLRGGSGHDALWRCDRRSGRHAARGDPRIPSRRGRQPGSRTPDAEFRGAARLAHPRRPRRGLWVCRRRCVYEVDLRRTRSTSCPGSLRRIVPRWVRDHPRLHPLLAGLSGDWRFAFTVSAVRDRRGLAGMDGPGTRGDRRSCDRRHAGGARRRHAGAKHRLLALCHMCGSEWPSSSARG